MHTRALATIVVLGLLATAAAEDEKAAPRHFVNVSADVGLAGVRAKDCIFTDLDGDGYWDLVLDRRRVYLSKKAETFELHAETGIEFPTVNVVPLAQDGSPDTAKGKEREYVPQYLYFADLDNDGDQDAVWGVHSSWEHFDGKSFVRVAECDHGLRSRVYLNLGDATFEQAKPSAFTADDAAGPAMALALVDANEDGVLDLFEGREYRRYGVLYGCGVDLLWRGDGQGGFTDVTESAGLLTVPEPGLATSSRPSYGATHADLDGDGRQDLLGISYGRQWNRQWRNLGKGKFEEVGLETGFAGDDITHGRYPDYVRERGRADEAPFRSNGNTFDCAVADFDNDGDLDCFLAEITHAWAGESSDLSALLVNEGGKFTRRTVAEFLPPRARRDERNWNNGDLHAGWLDYDNDGLQDLLLASGDYPDGQFLRLYRQLPDHTFEEATEAAGFDWEGAGDVSLGDYDRDGDVDVLVGRSFMRLGKAHRDKFMGGIDVNEVGLFRNDAANRSGNNWLNVRLIGEGKGHANRSGIGARIEVTTGELTQVREIRAGAGLANHQDPPEACFGLGTADAVDSLVIRWPDAGHTTTVLEDLPVNKFVTVTQGAKKPRLE